ncbi:MAG: DUF3108 domain-containing protein [Bacteroidales bacterium]|nr:DUF3108 domain-containing protein [Bacteroidales bacterium]
MSNTIKFFFSYLFFSIGFIVNAQNVLKEFPVFNSSERITYKAAYNWGFLWIKAGHVEFNISETKYKNQDVYHFYCFGRSLPSYDWIFKVRDSFQSYTSKENFHPLYYTRNTFENGYKVQNSFEFDYGKNLIYSKTQNTYRGYKADTLEFRNKIYDVVSGVYLVRNLDFSKYQINDIIPIKMIIDNEIFNLYIRYLGRETIKTYDKRIFKTIKISALLIEGTIFKGGEDLLVWISDDLNRVPVLVEAKILVGSVKAMLDSTVNLKYPLNSELK